MKIKTRLWIVLWSLLALMVFMMLFTTETPEFSNRALRGYRETQMAYRRENGLWVYQTDRNMFGEIEPPSDLYFDPSRVAANMVEGRGTFVGCSPLGDPKARKRAMDASKGGGGGYFRPVNSHGGLYDGKENLMFIRLWP